MTEENKYVLCKCGAYFWSFNQQLCPVCFERPLKEEFEERAAIKQFDGKMTREEAETQAGLEQLRRLKQCT